MFKNVSCNANNFFLVKLKIDRSVYDFATNKLGTLFGIKIVLHFKFLKLYNFERKKKKKKEQVQCELFNNKKREFIVNSLFQLKKQIHKQTEKNELKFDIKEL